MVNEWEAVTSQLPVIGFPRFVSLGLHFPLIVISGAMGPLW